MAISPGGRPADDSHFSTSTTSNWVARAGGLPKYVLEVAHALIRSGHSESSAIANAVAAMKRWAAGMDHVRPQVQAAAAKALAEWEAMRGKAHVAKGDIVAPRMTDQELIEAVIPHVDFSNVSKRKFTTEERRSLARQGKALPDGSYPIKDSEDLKNAARLAQSGHGNAAAAKKLIRRRAKKMKVKDPLAKREISDEEFAELSGWLDDPDDPDTDIEKADFELTGEISKVDTDQQLVFGWASIGTRANGEVLVDKQGDVLDDPDEIEKAAYKFVLHSREGGEMHVRKGVSTLVESFVSTPEKWKAMGIPEGTLPVGWWVGFKVNDPGVWNLAKSGVYKMFSVHGKGTRKRLD